ncbi:MAG TPA: hypothetical protein VM008_06870 [Phycisphaerae bacterium]|nr:hypothetical protein [Phycisphaerae bacterium]
MTQSPPDKSPRLNPRIIAMLVLFTLIISASVIATDIFSIRNRNPVPATSPTSR